MVWMEYLATDDADPAKQVWTRDPNPAGLFLFSSYGVADARAVALRAKGPYCFAQTVSELATPVPPTLHDLIAERPARVIRRRTSHKHPAAYSNDYGTASYA